MIMHSAGGITPTLASFMYSVFVCGEMRWGAGVIERMRCIDCLSNNWFQIKESTVTLNNESFKLILYSVAVVGGLNLVNLPFAKTTAETLWIRDHAPTLSLLVRLVVKLATRKWAPSASSKTRARKKRNVKSSEARNKTFKHLKSADDSFSLDKKHYSRATTWKIKLEF